MEQEQGNKVRRHGASVMYIVIVGIVFAILTVVFVFFPRSEYSELEKRDLKEFPDMADYSSNPAEFTAAVSSWFSDTEPYRDLLMTMSMNIRNAMRGNFLPEEEAVSFRPATQLVAETSAAETEPGEFWEDSEQRPDTLVEAPADIEDGNAKLGDSGTIIVGKGENVRALMAFGGTSKGGGGYVDLLNTLAATFPAQQVYAMIAPLATEFYLPAKAAKASNPQKPFIYSVRDRLSPKVKFVDVYDELSRHTKEDIYLRTDHHWAGLGGYYAARRLAQAAGVPFRGLDAYERHEVKDFVGSMYGYSKDIAVKNAPEDFIYYVPSQVSYEAQYVAYTLDKNFRIVKESKPYKSSLFKHFKDGSGNAYLTFIGSDQVFVKVKTSTPGNRRLLIIKDSYGNAVPGNLLYSFNEVHVVDFRYFTHNLKQYVADNGITDIAVCFNVFNAYSSGSASKVKKMLTHKGGLATPDAGQNHKDTTLPSSTESKTRNENKASESTVTVPQTSAQEPSESNENTNKIEKTEIPDNEETTENTGTTEQTEE